MTAVQGHARPSGPEALANRTDNSFELQWVTADQFAELGLHPLHIRNPLAELVATGTSPDANPRRSERCLSHDDGIEDLRQRRTGRSETKRQAPPTRRNRRYRAHTPPPILVVAARAAGLGDGNQEWDAPRSSWLADLRAAVGEGRRSSVRPALRGLVGAGKPGLRRRAADNVPAAAGDGACGARRRARQSRSCFRRPQPARSRGEQRPHTARASGATVRPAREWS